MNSSPAKSHRIKLLHLPITQDFIGKFEFTIIWFYLKHPKSTANYFNVDQGPEEK